MSNVHEEVKTLISSICGIEEEMIKPETNLIDELSIDSIDFMDVTYEIDKKYKIKLPVADWMTEINAGTAKVSDYFVMSRLVERIEQLTVSA